MRLWKVKTGQWRCLSNVQRQFNTQFLGSNRERLVPYKFEFGFDDTQEQQVSRPERRAECEEVQKLKELHWVKIIWGFKGKSNHFITNTKMDQYPVKCS